MMQLRYLGMLHLLDAGLRTQGVQELTYEWEHLLGELALIDLQLQEVCEYTLWNHVPYFRHRGVQVVCKHCCHYAQQAE
jgi:hypothetical protein